MRALRSDASRNREKALCAARRLFAERGAQVTMEEIATAAGIGKGTLYRGFPSRAAVAAAILDTLSRDLQGRLLQGMGVAERGPLAVLTSFLDALHGFVLDNLDLFCMAQDSGGGFRSGTHYLWERHAVTALVRQAQRAGECGQVDLDLVPDAVLTLVSPDLVRHQRDVAGADPDAMRLLMHDMLGGALGLAPRARTPA